MLIKIKPDMFINTESISCFYKKKETEETRENRIFFADNISSEKVEDEFADELSKYLEEDETFVLFISETTNIYINTKQIFKISLKEKDCAAYISFNSDKDPFTFRFEDSKALESNLTRIQEKLNKSTYVDHF